MYADCTHLFFRNMWLVGHLWAITFLYWYSDRNINQVISQMVDENLKVFFKEEYCLDLSNKSNFIVQLTKTQQPHVNLLTNPLTRQINLFKRASYFRERSSSSLFMAIIRNCDRFEASSDSTFLNGLQNKVFKFISVASNLHLTSSNLHISCI